MTASSWRPAARAWTSAAAALAALALAGCAGKKEIFPDDLAPMTEVYDEHFERTGAEDRAGARAKLHGSGEASSSLERARRDAAGPAGEPGAGAQGDGGEPDTSGEPDPRQQRGGTTRIAAEATPDYTGYTRTARRELNVLFPRLANPTLVLYVYPHLTANGAGVPGYATKFRLYETDHYAQPGEAHAPNALAPGLGTRIGERPAPTMEVEDEAGQGGAPHTQPARQGDSS